MGNKYRRKSEKCGFYVLNCNNLRRKQKYHKIPQFTIPQSPLEIVLSKTTLFHLPGNGAVMDQDKSFPALTT